MALRRTWLGLALAPALVAALAASAGCSGESDEGNAQSAHTAEALAWGHAAAPMWAALDRSIFDSRYPDKTAAGHVVEQRLDAWVQHLDGLARGIIRSATAADAMAPKPYVRLLVAKTPRIAGQRVLACVAGAPSLTISDGGLGPGLDAAPAPVAKDAGATSADAGTLEALAVLVGESTVFSTNVGNASCLSTPGWSAEDGLRWFNALGGHRISNRGGFGVVERTGAESVAAKRVAIESAAPAIDVSTSIVSGLSETAMAVALARELARYHRAHETTGVHDRFGFVYEREDPAGAREPAADQNALRASIEKVHIPRFLIAGQKLHARVVPTLLRWMTKLDWDAAHPCFEAKRFLLNDTTSAKDELTLDWRTTETAPDPLSAAGRRAVLSWEPKAVRCMDALDLTEGSGPSTFPHGKLGAADTKLPRAWFLDNIDGPLREGARLAATELRVATLRALVTRLEEVAKGLDEQASDLEKKLRDNRLAIATEVQEADAVALELAVRSGIAPRRVFDAFFELMTLEESSDPEAFALANANVSVEECKSWFDVGFREQGPDGVEREFYVPGALSPEKPSWCVRVHDLLREARVHSYPPRPATGPFDAASWATLQTLAEALTASAPDEPAAPAPPTTSEPAQGPVPTATPIITGDDLWHDEGWTPPRKAGTVANSQPTRRFAAPRKESCSVSAGVVGRTSTGGAALGAFGAFGALSALRVLTVRRRRPSR